MTSHDTGSTGTPGTPRATAPPARGERAQQRRGVLKQGGGRALDAPEEIKNVLQPVKGRRLFTVVPEETADPERFRSLAGEVTEAQGRQYNDRRWHTHEGDLLVHDGQTYALTNQWGKKWLEAMELLKERFPQVGLRWEPTSSDE